jgi:hypothetical protein
VSLRYNTQVRPDIIRVYYRGRLIAETPGAVSGLGTVTFDWNPTPGGADAYVVEVEVIGRDARTQWSYLLQCPRR